MSTPRRLRPGDPDYNSFLDEVKRGSTGPMYFDKQGEPISLRQYGELFEDVTYQRLRYEQIGQFEVSTVWIGIGLMRDEQDRPLIFETATNVLGEGFQPVLRYATEQEALEGHESFALLARGMDSKGLSLDDADVSGEQPNNEG